MRLLVTALFVGVDSIEIWDRRSVNSFKARCSTQPCSAVSI